MSPLIYVKAVKVALAVIEVAEKNLRQGGEAEAERHALDAGIAMARALRCLEAKMI